MKKRQLRKVWVVPLFFSLLFAGCSANQEQPVASEGSKGQVVEFKYPNNPSFDLVYIADELGYFKDTNIRPKYVGKISDPQIIPSVVSGTIDMGARMTPLVISAVLGGGDVKIIAAGTQSTQVAPHMEYFVRKDSGIHSVKDLEGKTIGINSFGACAEHVTKKYLTAKGVDINKVKFTVIPNDQIDQALAQGKIDLAVIHPPFSGRALKNPELKRLFSDWDIDHGASGMMPYTMNGKFLRAHPAEVKTLIGVLAKAAKWADDHPDDARQLIAKRLHMDVNLVQRYAFYQDQVVPDIAVQYWVDELENQNQIPKGKIKSTDVYTNTYNPNYKGGA